jgi:hypothetical protein
MGVAGRAHRFRFVVVKPESSSVPPLNRSRIASCTYDSDFNAVSRSSLLQVYSGTVRVGTIYKTSGNPAGNQWYWGLNGVQNGPGPFNNEFVRTLDDAKAEFPPPGALGSRLPG